MGMMTYLRQMALLLTLSGGAAAVVTALVCRVGRKTLSARWRYLIWVLPALLFVLPIRLPAAPFSPPPQVHTAVVPVEGVSVGTGESEGLVHPAADAGQTETASPGRTASQTVLLPEGYTPLVQDLLLPIWGAGVLVLLAWEGMQLLRLRRFVRRCTGPAGEEERAALEAGRRALGIRKKVALRRFAGVGSPFLTGLIHPCIYLPQTQLSRVELDLVLAHELTHCRRRDLLWKRLARLIRTLHWFNPAAWLLESEVGRTCELSCDEAVAVALDTQGKRQYGLTILKLMRGAPAPMTACLAQRQLRHRLEDMMKYQKRGLTSRVLAVALALFLGLSGVTLSCALESQYPAGRYETDQFTQLWVLRGDREQKGENGQTIYLPGTGFTSHVTGTARLVDQPGEQSFSARIQAAGLNRVLYGVDHHSGPSEIQVEMTQLHTVSEAAGTWTGLFTVWQDGEEIFTNTPGRITNVPSLSRSEDGLCELFVEQSNGNWLSLDINFQVSGSRVVDAAARKEAQEAALAAHPDTRLLALTVEPGNRIAGEAIMDTQPPKSGEPYPDVLINVQAGMARLCCTLTRETQGRDFSGAPNWVLSLEKVSTCSTGAVSGTFLLQDSRRYEDLCFRGTLSGLDGADGDPVTLRSDDGAVNLQFRLWQARREPSIQESILQTGGLRGSQTMATEDYQALLAQAEYDALVHITLTDLPFRVEWSQAGITLTYTGPKGAHWAAVLYNSMGKLYWETGQQGSPFQGAYAVQTGQKDSSEGGVFLPFAPDGGPDTYTLYVGAWSTQDGAAGADYILEFHRGTQQVLPLLCRMEDRVYLDNISGEQALAFLQMTLPEYLFDEHT